MTKYKTKYKYIPSFLLLFLTLWPLASPAQIQPTPHQKECTTITWQNLQQTVLETFENGPGQRAILLQQGAKNAEKAVSGRLRSLDISAGAEFPLGSDTWKDRDQGIEAMLNIQLGSLASQLKNAWQAEANADRATANAEHWQFADEVLNAYLEAWVQTAIALHTQENIATALTELEPLRTAADKQLISRLDLLDLEAELGRLTAELAQTLRDAQAANIQLAKILGQSCVHIDDHSPAQTTSTELIEKIEKTENPWTPLLAKLNTHPLVQSSQAAAELASQQALAARKAAPWELSIGAGFYTSGFGSAWPVAQLGLAIPLTNPDRAEAERLHATAAAHQADVRWQIRLARSQIEGFRNSYTAAAQQQKSIQTTWLAPLVERQKLLEEAFQQRQIPLERVIRGRRELLDARKQLFLVTTELLVATRRAQLLDTLATTLATTNNTEQNP